MSNYSNQPDRRAPDISTPVAKRRRSGLSKLFPLIFFLLFAGFVLTKAVPAIDDFVQSIIQPQRHMAVMACREAALEKRGHSAFSRILDGGESTRTKAGFFVDKVLIGDLEENTGEVRFRVSCHVGLDGKLANIQVKPVAVMSEQMTEGLPAALEKIEEYE